MAKTNICYHSLHLNMDNEQHQRVEKVLANLNTDCLLYTSDAADEL